MKFFFALIVFILFIYFYTPIHDALNNQVTVYRALNIKGKLHPSSTATYKIFPESQKVVHVMIDIPSKYYLNKMDKCKVLDRLNWVCEYNDGSGVLIMKDGQFYEQTPDGVDLKDNSTNIGRFQYWTSYFKR